jgi:hypothetical protein
MYSFPTQWYTKAPQTENTTISEIVTAQSAEVDHISDDVLTRTPHQPLGKSLGFSISAMNFKNGQMTLVS